MCSEEFDFFKALRQITYGCNIRLPRCEDQIIHTESDDEDYDSDSDQIADLILVPNSDSDQIADLILVPEIPSSQKPKGLTIDNSNSKDCPCLPESSSGKMVQEGLRSLILQPEMPPSQKLREKIEDNPMLPTSKDCPYLPESSSRKMVQEESRSLILQPKILSNLKPRGKMKDNSTSKDCSYLPESSNRKMVQEESMSLCLQPEIPSSQKPRGKIKDKSTSKDFPCLPKSSNKKMVQEELKSLSLQPEIPSSQKPRGKTKYNSMLPTSKDYPYLPESSNRKMVQEESRSISGKLKGSSKVFIKDASKLSHKSSASQEKQSFLPKVNQTCTIVKTEFLEPDTNLLFTSTSDEMPEIIQEKLSSPLKKHPKLNHQKLENSLRNISPITPLNQVVQKESSILNQILETSTTQRTSTSDLPNSLYVPLEGTFDVEGMGISIQWCQTQAKPEVSVRKCSDLCRPEHLIMSRNILRLLKPSLKSSFMWFIVPQISASTDSISANTRLEAPAVGVQPKLPRTKITAKRGQVNTATVESLGCKIPDEAVPANKIQQETQMRNSVREQVNTATANSQGHQILVKTIPSNKTQQEIPMRDTAREQVNMASANSQGHQNPVKAVPTNKTQQVIPMRNTAREQVMATAYSPGHQNPVKAVPTNKTQQEIPMRDTAREQVNMASANLPGHQIPFRAVPINKTQQEVPTRNTAREQLSMATAYSPGHQITVTAVPTNIPQQETPMRNLPPRKRPIDSTHDDATCTTCKRIRKENISQANIDSNFSWTCAIELLHALAIENPGPQTRAINKLATSIRESAIDLEQLLLKIIKTAIEMCKDEYKRLVSLKTLILKKMMDESTAAKFNINNWTAKVESMFQKYSRIQLPPPYPFTNGNQVPQYTVPTNPKSLKIQQCPSSYPISIEGRQQIIQQPYQNQLIPQMVQQPYQNQLRSQVAQQPYQNQLPVAQPRNLPSINNQYPIYNQQEQQCSMPQQQQQLSYKSQLAYTPCAEQEQQFRAQQISFPHHQQQQQQYHVHNIQRIQQQLPYKMREIQNMQHLQQQSQQQQQQSQQQQQQMPYTSQSFMQQHQSHHPQAQQQSYQEHQQWYPQQPLQSARSMYSGKASDLEVSRGVDYSPPIANTAPSPLTPSYSTLKATMSQNLTCNSQEVFLKVTYKQGTNNISSQSCGAAYPYNNKYLYQPTQDANCQVAYNQHAMQQQESQSKQTPSLDSYEEIEGLIDNIFKSKDNNVSKVTYNGLDLADILNNNSKTAS